MTDLERLAAAIEAGTVDGYTPHCDLDVIRVLMAYHGSLDAAKALHDAVLPGWGWDVSSSDAAAVFFGNELTGPCELAAAETPARAWLLAIVRALIAKDAAK